MGARGKPVVLGGWDRAHGPARLVDQLSDCLRINRREASRNYPSAIGPTAGWGQLRPMSPGGFIEPIGGSIEPGGIAGSLRLIRSARVP